MKNYELKPFTGDSTFNYKKNLNPQQIKVIEEADGPCLVLAGAGSGKTRILIYRLAYLLNQGVYPENILLVTFTNKAALEMIHRSEALMNSTLSKLWAGTFHHIGNLILRKEAPLIDYTSNFTIADTADACDLIDDSVQELGIFNKDKLFPKKNIIYNIRSLADNTQKDAEEIIDEFYPYVGEYTPYIKKVLTHYAKKKKEANVMDFDDLLINWLKLLNIDQVCQRYSQLFRYVMIDEYQDTNKLQFKILQKLSSYYKNILAVGDDAQSIYSFRGADIKNLLDFPRVFKNAKIFKLETNYRSTPQVLSLANEVIARNINQFPKKLQAVKESGEAPMAIKAKDVYQQAKFVGQRVIALHNEGIPLKEMAVLFRSRFQALELEVELLKRNIPYVVRGGVRFFEQAHIKDVLSYLKALINPKDELAFKRALSLHKGIGRGFAHKIWGEMTKENKSLSEIEKTLPKRTKEGFNHFASIMETLKQSTTPQKAITEILKFYKDHCYLSFERPEDRILDLEELSKMAARQSSIKSFVTDLDAFESFKGQSFTSTTDIEDLLILSTIHQAKGLEWETVFIIGFSDYDFPHPKALNSKESMEEERRLFYVASTRAKSLLHIVYPEQKQTFKNGLVITRASQFLHELPKETYEEYDLVENR
ncbi:MAG: ATP-dependent helicase [Candidatus Omnitrophota bacterium]|nr:ATP-dependent helicase [Candidatus Omnitrophota bacterium]